MTEPRGENGTTEAAIQRAIEEWATIAGGPHADQGEQVTLARYIATKLPVEDFYALFTAELDKVEIKADMPAAAVVGECVRAAKRAQNTIEAGHSDEPADG